MILLSVDSISKNYFLKANNINQETFALQKVSFNLKKGERLGIIGRNGSGKSTLLKIIAGLVKPDAGTIEIVGRLNSILEIGDNFIEDLSGHENIELFLKLKGLKGRPLEEAIKNARLFSELGDYLYQPLKSYSNGMKLRLGMGASLQVEADLMLIDEVFSAGDAYFKEKVKVEFKNKLLKNTGLILVSHTPEEILEFCNQCMWIENGQIRLIGDAKEVLERYYYELAKEKSERDYFAAQTINPNSFNNVGDFEIAENDLVRLDNFVIHNVDSSAKITYKDEIAFKVSLFKKVKNMTLFAQIVIYDFQMKPVLMITHQAKTKFEKEVEELKDFTGKCEYLAILPSHMLTFGNYYAELKIGKNTNADQIHNEEAIKLPVNIHFKILKEDSIDLSGANEQVFVKPVCKWKMTTS